MFENKKVDGIHYSRLAASFRNQCGTGCDYDFKEWLEHLRDTGVLPSLTEKDIADCMEIGFCGKFELERNVKAWLKGE